MGSQTGPTEPEIFTKDQINHLTTTQMSKVSREFSFTFSFFFSQIVIQIMSSRVSTEDASPWKTNATIMMIANMEKMKMTVVSLQQVPTLDISLNSNQPLKYLWFFELS